MNKKRIDIRGILKWFFGSVKFYFTNNFHLSWQFYKTLMHYKVNFLILLPNYCKFLKLIKRRQLAFPYKLWKLMFHFSIIFIVIDVHTVTTNFDSVIKYWSHLTTVTMVIRLNFSNNHQPIGPIPFVRNLPTRTKISFYNQMVQIPHFMKFVLIYLFIDHDWKS